MITDEQLINEILQRANLQLKSRNIELPEAYYKRLIPEITEAMITSLIWGVKNLAIKNKGEGSLSFRQIFDIVITNRVSEDGEKDGNIMISFVPGPQAKLMAKSDDISESAEE